LSTQHWHIRRRFSLEAYVDAQLELLPASLRPEPPADSGRLGTAEDLAFTAAPGVSTLIGRLPLATSPEAQPADALVGHLSPVPVLRESECTAKRLVGRVLRSLTNANTRAI
jgi:hypothetical protein